MIFKEGTVAQKAETPIYLLVYGGIGMSIGMFCFGRRVNTTIGTSLTKIVPMRWELSLVFELFTDVMIITIHFDDNFFLYYGF